MVKNVWVKIQATGAAETKAALGDIAAEGRELNRMDPTVKVDVDRSGLGALSRLMDGLSKALGGIPGIGGALAKLPPQAQLGAIAAALAALPFLAQIAASAITFALGGAITAIGIHFAMQNPKIAKEWKALTATMSADLAQISKPFVGALDVIIKVARALLPEIMGPLGTAMKAIAGPFTTFATSLLAAFAQPAVGQAIVAVGNAFGGMLKALSPTLAGDIRAIANGITEIANAVAKNPGAFAAFISFFFRLAAGALTAIAYLTQVAAYIENHFLPTIRKIGQLSGVVAGLKIILDTIALAWKLTMDLLQFHWHRAWEDIKAYGIQVWNAIKDTGVRIWHAIDSAIGGILDGMRHHIANIFDGVRHDIAHYWDVAWNDTIGRIIRGVGDVGRWFTSMKLRIGTILSELPGILFQAGVNAIQHLISGLLSQLGPLGSAVGTIVSKIAGFFGLSPAREGPLSGGGSMEIRGRRIVQDLARGIAAETAGAGAAAGLLARSVVPGALAAGAGGGWVDARVSFQPTGDPLIDAIFRGLRLKIRATGGGGPQSVQRALGQVWR